MTNKEYLTHELDGLGLSEKDVEIILLKASLDADAEADAHKCDLAIYSRFSTVLKGCARNVTEGGYSISWNMDAVRLFYKALCDELGVDDTLLDEIPKIRDRSNLW